MSMTARVLLLAGMAALFPSLSIAQTPNTQTPIPPPPDEAFINISAGAQLQTHSFTSNTSFPLYDETATVSASQTVGKGFLFDISAGHRFWHHLYGAIGVSTFKGGGDATVTASIPDPLLFNHPAVSTHNASDLGQSVVAINLQLVWMAPINDKLDFAIAIGPSIMHVSQDIPSVPIPPAGTQTVTITTTSESLWTARAGMLGFDVSYKISGQYRAGILVRYQAGEADFQAAPKLRVGGMQFGGGLRIRF